MFAIGQTMAIFVPLNPRMWHALDLAAQLHIIAHTSVDVMHLFDELWH